QSDAVRQEAQIKCRCGAYAHGTRDGSNGLLQFTEALVYDGQRPCGICQEGFAGLSQGDPFAAAVEQTLSDLFLQLGDLVGQCRLRDMDTFSCARKVQRACQSDEIP